MKILHLVHAYHPAVGGSEYLVQQVSEYLANDCGDDVTVFTTFAYNSALFTGRKTGAMPKSREKEVINNVKIRRFPVINRWAKFLYIAQHIFYRFRLPGNGFWRRLYYGPLAPKMKKAAADFDADVIVSAPFPLNHMQYGFKNKVPVILVGCMHTVDKHGFHNPWILKAIRKADGYIALTPHEKEFLVEQWGIDENRTRIEVIGVGIDTRHPSASPNSTREQIGIGSREPLIVFFGQHGLHKGINILIRAMSRVWEKFPDTRLIIAGGTTPFTGSFKKLARSVEMGSGQQDRIHFLDNVDEKRKYEIIEACDIFASPSGYESFGITILEAWMKRKPVVACNIEATRNLVRDGETGFLVEYNNHTQLAETLVRLIENPDLRKKAGENGHRKLKENYTREIIGKKYRDFYDKIVHSKNKMPG
jgi:glycosyltransferase involved in cell wall biosynthesis